MRAFVAVPVGDEPALGRPATTREHLTLHFLGEIDPALLPRLAEGLAAVAGAHRPFAISIEGVGAFPRPDQPRVVWRGVGEGRGELAQLAAAVREADAAAGAPSDERTFAPHLTLFRVRSAADAARARDLLDGRTPPPPPSRWTVRELQLIESVRLPSGLEHRVRAREPLGG